MTPRSVGRPWLAAAGVACAVLVGCTAPAPRGASGLPPGAVLPAPAVSVYLEPPLSAPTPVAVAWAPPPMLVEPPPPGVEPGAVWTGGFWAWQGDWVWAAGRWILPPRPGYTWVQPAYEHRDHTVVYTGGHWRAPGGVAAAPLHGARVAAAIVLPGVVPGPPPEGPQGSVVPPPPGSRPGIVVPAPIGTPPALMVGAPPVVRVGMRVRPDPGPAGHAGARRADFGQLRVTAPATATAEGRAYEALLPAQAYLAASMPPVVRALAPQPQSSRPIAPAQAGRAPAPLPAAQAVKIASP